METKTYNIRLDGIEIVEKSLAKVNIQENDQFNFDVKAQIGLDTQKKLIIAAVEVTIRKLDNPIHIANFLIVIGFVIKDFDEVLKVADEDKYIIPLELENLLKSISISTMRGIMFSELRGTILHKAVLPVMTMDSFKPIDVSLITKIEENR